MADGEVEDVDSLKTCLILLEDESEGNELHATLDVLLKIHQNLLKNPKEDKYKQLRKGNKTIKEKVWKYEGAKEFLFAAGWTEVDDLLMYLDESNVRLDTVIQVIEEKIHTLPPLRPVPQPPTVKPVETTHSSWTSEELREKEELIDKEKQRRMEEFKRDKKEKEAIKKQIMADRKDANTRETKESHARNMNFGATFKKFENKG